MFRAVPAGRRHRRTTWHHRGVPELPEVRAAAGWLTANLGGHEVAKVSIGSLSFVKTFEPSPDSLVGRTIDSVTTRGKFLVFNFAEPDPVHAVVHLSLGGWLKWRANAPTTPLKLNKQPVAIRMHAEPEGALEIFEAGHEKRAAMWIVRDLNEIERVQELGPDVDDSSVALELFVERLAGLGASPLKSALRNQHALAGIGNAWSDEILHRAKLSPFTRANKMTALQQEALFDAVRHVLAGATERLAPLPLDEMKDSKRGGLVIHNHAGDECPVCGSTIASIAGSGSSSFQYCPGCQTGGRVLADRRLSRLLT